MTKVVSDISSAVDNGSLSVVVLLNLSVAFDTVYHTILLRRLPTLFGVSDPVSSRCTLPTGHSTYLLASVAPGRAP